MVLKLTKSPKLIFLLLVIAIIPTFYRMLRPGLYSMQDFHFFRLYEFDRCVRDLQIPCRWAPDAGLGYGEPIFNFYGQLPYAVGEVFHLGGFSKVDSLKILFILSLVGSAFSMFFLARGLWASNSAAFLSGILYVWAPYRAVDVWVRGALSEALAFVLFPMIVYQLNLIFLKEKTVNLLLFSLLVAALILTHNLSVLMLGLIFLFWLPYQVVITGKWRILGKIFIALVFSALLSTFYILPVVAESRFIQLESTITGYFDFRGHFAGISQLLFSRYWGYGASLFGPDDRLSLSVGHFQWIVPLITLIIALVKTKKLSANFLLLLCLGWFALFLTHNKSTFIWEHVAPLAFIQFPWRFLAVSVFAFALSSGALVNLVGRYAKLVVALLGVGIIFVNVSFFKEDIWRQVTDQDLIKGSAWEEQIAASIADYWPRFGRSIPTRQAPTTTPDVHLLEKKSNRIIYQILKDEPGETQFPVAYFPGWQAEQDGRKFELLPTGDYGVSTAKLPDLKDNVVTLKFHDTPVRRVANLVSLFALLLLSVLLFRNLKYAT